MTPQRPTVIHFEWKEPVKKRFCPLSSENANHPKCAFADSESTAQSSVLSGLMVSLTPVNKPKIERPIQLSDVEFESIDHLCQVLNDTLSKAEDVKPVPTPRPECRVLCFDKGSRHQQYVNCHKQDCENLVYYVEQTRKYDRDAQIAGHRKDAWTWEGKDD